MKHRLWAVIDWVAHVLYACHLIPERLEERICDQYDKTFK